ncbi:helix-turn-helix domain-containing protein [Empedobacter falsenii]
MFCTFGELLRKIRTENNLTLVEMSKILDIDNSLLGKIENNIRNPTEEIIEKISEKFNSNFEDLIIASYSDRFVDSYNRCPKELKEKIVKSFLYKIDNEVKEPSK